jgi:hypothetical protein
VFAVQNDSSDIEFNVEPAEPEAVISRTHELRVVDLEHVAGLEVSEVFRVTAVLRMTVVLMGTLILVHSILLES